jgi:hypothetical protein
VSALSAGAQVGPKQKFAPGDAYLQVSSFGFGNSRRSGFWGNIEYGFVGLKFTLGGKTHYGWARIKFPQPRLVTYPSIYGYAYESTPNKPIVAGYTGGAPASASAQSNSEAPGLGQLAAGAQGLNSWRRSDPKQ